MKCSSSFDSLILKLKLEKHPEGGYFKETYSSKDIIKVPERYKGKTRVSSTHIYYLLSGENFSAWHRVKSDEIWHFYAGRPINLYIIDNNIKNINIITLGNPLSNLDTTFQYCVEQGQWFAAQPVEREGYSLVGCTVSPGFDFRDWELADRKNLLDKYPQHEELVRKFTLPSSEETNTPNSTSEQS